MTDLTRSLLKQSLSIIYLPIQALQLNPRNPRLHSKRQIKQIAQSIQRFGFNVPVLANSLNQVLVGHGRVLAAQLLGLTEVPVIRIEFLTDAQAQAFAIADNRLQEHSSWDHQLLAEIFTELAALELDFSLEDTGFSMGEIDLRIEGLSAVAEAGPDPADQLPEPSSVPPVSALGDSWQLGRHRLLCGNALEGISYEVLMQGAPADIIFTDPPYNVRIDGHVSGKGRIHHREFPMAVGEMSEAEFSDFLWRVCRLLTFHSRAGSIHYIFMDWRHAHELLVVGKRVYHELKNICVWVKNNGGMGSLYRSQHEMIFVFKHGSASHANNVQLGQYGRYRTNVWNYPGANAFGRQGEEGNWGAYHPTVKPVSMVADAIMDCSARGDVVLDPFLGSGTTLIAAERVGRVCYGLELDPLYVDLAIRRWQRHSGDSAIHVATGERFDDRAAKAEVCHG
jgi:DNA modification methylase